jgi:hypothetical protein
MREMDSGRIGIGSFAAGLALAAAAAGMAGGVPIRPAPRDDFDMRPEPSQRKRRGPMPKPSQPMSDTYRANVRAQRGFSTNRLVQLRKQWLFNERNARATGRDVTPWADWLNQHRKTALEKQFAASPTP